MVGLKYMAIRDRSRDPEFASHFRPRLVTVPHSWNDVMDLGGRACGRDGT